MYKIGLGFRRCNSIAEVKLAGMDMIDQQKFLRSF